MRFEFITHLWLWSNHKTLETNIHTDNKQYQQITVSTQLQRCCLASPKLFACVLQDEVIAVAEKVILRLEDLVKWTVWDPDAWNRGRKVIPLDINSDKSGTDSSLCYQESTLSCGLNFKDVLKEKATLGKNWHLIFLCRDFCYWNEFQSYFYCICYNTLIKL